MLGYDISWAGFNIVEVMSSSKFTYKRIGYLAASQCFNQDTEVSDGVVVCVVFRVVKKNFFFYIIFIKKTSFQVFIVYKTSLGNY